MKVNHREKEGKEEGRGEREETRGREGEEKVRKYRMR